jgi:hypothetical protein
MYMWFKESFWEQMMGVPLKVKGNVESVFDY